MTAAITHESSHVPVDRDAPAAVIIAALQLAIAAALVGLEPVGVAPFVFALALQCGLASLSVPGSLAASVAMLPLFHEPLEVGSSSFALSEIILWAALAGAALAVVARSGAAMFDRSPGPWARAPSLTSIWMMRRHLPLLPVAILAALAGVGLLLLFGVDDSTARAAGLREWRWTLLEPLVLLALLMLFARDREERLVLAIALVGGGVLAGVWGLGQLIEGGGVIAADVRRIDGPFPHPNAFALFLLRIVVFTGVLAILSRRLRPAAAVATVITGAALLATFARSALVSLVATAALVSGWASRRVQLAGAITVVLGIVVLLLVAGDRMVGPSGTDSLALRVDIWQSGLEMIRDRPVLGYGPDQFLYTYSPRYVEPTAWDERFTAHGHNFFIDAWVRLGIIGAAFALLGVLWIALAVSRVVRNPGRWNPLGAAAVVALAAAVIQGMVDNGYFAHDLAMSAWLLAWLAFDSPSGSSTGGP